MNVESQGSQIKNKFGNLRASNPSVLTMPVYQSRRSRHVSPEMLIKNRSKKHLREPRYPSSHCDGFLPHLDQYTAPFGHNFTSTGLSRSHKSTKSAHQHSKRDGSIAHTSLARYMPTVHHSEPSEPSSSPGDFSSSDQGSNTPPTSPDWSRGGERG